MNYFLNMTEKQFATLCDIAKQHAIFLDAFASNMDDTLDKFYDDVFNDGIIEAGKYLSLLVIPDEKGGLTREEIREIFDLEYNKTNGDMCELLYNIFNTYTYAKIIELIKEFLDNRGFKSGDIIYNESCDDYAIVTSRTNNPGYMILSKKDGYSFLHSENVDDWEKVLETNEIWDTIRKIKENKAIREIDLSRKDLTFLKNGFAPNNGTRIDVNTFVEKFNE